MTPYLPQRGPAGDGLQIVKNGGKGNLILDYKYFWIVESTSPVGQPSGITQQQSVSMGSNSGTYLAGGGNSFLLFQDGNTYLSVENLTGPPISVSAMQAIGQSFQSVK